MNRHRASGRDDLANPTAVMPRLVRAIQYATADVVKACSSMPASGTMDRPIKSGDDTCRVSGYEAASLARLPGRHNTIPAATRLSAAHSANAEV